MGDFDVVLSEYLGDGFGEGGMEWKGNAECMISCLSVE